MEYKLTNTMQAGLLKMAAILGCGAKDCMAVPNDNTGRALLRRGLLELSPGVHVWPRYTITDAGRAEVERIRSAWK